MIDIEIIVEEVSVHGLPESEMFDLCRVSFDQGLSGSWSTTVLFKKIDFDLVAPTSLYPAVRAHRGERFIWMRR